MSNQQIDKVTSLSVIDPIMSEIEGLSQTSGLSVARFVYAAKMALEQTPKLFECEPTSLRRAILACVRDGLMPDSKEAVILPYGKEAQYQPMVAGVIKRLRELGGVFSISCELVCEKDTFFPNLADPDDTQHTMPGFGDRGAIVGCYTIFRDDKNRVMHREIMSRAELDFVRSKSKSPDSPAYKSFEGEMFRKMTLRRGSKYISINNTALAEMMQSIDSMFEFNSSVQIAPRMDPFSGKTIENKPEEKQQISQKHTAEERKPDANQKPKEEQKPEPHVYEVPVETAFRPVFMAAIEPVLKAATANYPDFDVDAALAAVRAEAGKGRASVRAQHHRLFDHLVMIAEYVLEDRRAGVTDWPTKIRLELGKASHALGPITLELPQ
jgi:phage RecT family recombinase